MGEQTTEQKTEQTTEQKTEEKAGETWPRTARLDAPHVLDRIAEITGVRLVLEGPCPGGEVGAAYVRWPDGRRSVLTHGRTRSAALVDKARAAGVPTPRQELAAHVDGVRVLVQQRLPGLPPQRTDAHLITQMIAVTDRFAGLLADTAPRPAELYLTTGGPGFCLHEPLAAYSPRTARLLDWVHEVGASGSIMVGDDLTHMDFHPGNVLVDDAGRLTGVIDWDGAVRGDRHFDLVTLRFSVPAPLTGPIDDRLAGLSPLRRRAFWAHMSLRHVDWAIRHHDAATVDKWLTIAEQGLQL